MVLKLYLEWLRFHGCETFENFLFNLDVNFDEIPQTHVFVNMPNHMAWPSTLTNPVKEFVEEFQGDFYFEQARTLVIFSENFCVSLKCE